MEKVLNGYQWYLEKKVSGEYSQVSSTRDVFKARWSHMDQLCLNFWQEPNEVALFSAVIGELGNNCFDHNLGQWRDAAGCWFQHDIQKKSAWVVVADRGQGVLSSLRQTLPTLRDDQMALNTAFEKKISGRSPEHRGNGLKFVRNIINRSPQSGLVCLSGNGEILLGKLSLKAKHMLVDTTFKTYGTGTFSLVIWRSPNES